jgi:hypothetical protein
MIACLKASASREASPRGPARIAAAPWHRQICDVAEV